MKQASLYQFIFWTTFSELKLSASNIPPLCSSSANLGEIHIQRVVNLYLLLLSRLTLSMWPGGRVSGMGEGKRREM